VDKEQLYNFATKNLEEREKEYLREYLPQVLEPRKQDKL
jgi:hypothetical protein